VTGWRSAVLLEASAAYSPAYRGVRTTSTGSVPKRKYVEYRGGVKELYDLSSDPGERTNRYPSSAADPLATRLQNLKGCAGGACFTFENGP
jgi:hypothetical protein